jgi:hypothetical protein
MRCTVQHCVPVEFSIFMGRNGGLDLIRRPIAAGATLPSQAQEKSRRLPTLAAIASHFAHSKSELREELTCNPAAESGLASLALLSVCALGCELGCSAGASPAARCADALASFRIGARREREDGIPQVRRLYLAEWRRALRCVHKHRSMRGWLRVRTGSQGGSNTGNLARQILIRRSGVPFARPLARMENRQLEHAHYAEAARQPSATAIPAIATGAHREKGKPASTCAQPARGRWLACCRPHRPVTVGLLRCGRRKPAR